MKASIFGNKSRFAIDLQYNPAETSPYGYFRFWLGNVPIGSFEEKNMIIPHLASFKRLIDILEDLINFEFESKKSDEVLDVIFNSVNDFSEKYRFSVGEASDDYEISCYLPNESEIVFCARLVKSPFFEHPNFPSEGIRVRLDVTTFQETVSEALKVFGLLVY